MTKCKMCIYWACYGEDKSNLGECRRHAPTRKAGWSDTSEDEWCGDGEARAAMAGDVLP
jgi:hypothetical protein